MPNMILFFISSIHSSFDAGNIIKVNQIARQIECPVDNTNGLPVTLLEGVEKAVGVFASLTKFLRSFHITVGISSKKVVNIGVLEVHQKF